MFICSNYVKWYITVEQIDKVAFAAQMDAPTPRIEGDRSHYCFCHFEGDFANYGVRHPCSYRLFQILVIEAPISEDCDFSDHRNSDRLSRGG